MNKNTLKEEVTGAGTLPRDPELQAAMNYFAERGCSIDAMQDQGGKELIADWKAALAKAPDETLVDTDAGKAPREKWALVYSDEHHWLVGFDGGGRPIWSMNRLRAGVFAPSEIDLANVQFIETK